MHARGGGGQRYSCTLSSTPAQDGVACERHAPAALPPGREIRCALYKRLGGPQVRCGRVRKMWLERGFDPHILQPVASRFTYLSCHGPRPRMYLTEYSDALFERAYILGAPGR
jgi:hypothetical protein